MRNEIHLTLGTFSYRQSANILVLENPHITEDKRTLDMNKPELKAGMPLDIIFENEVNRPKAHYMKAVVYDFDNHAVTISQTSPALNKHFLNRRLLITFLVTIENRILRFGFAGLLADLISDYSMSSGTTVEALRIKKLAAPEPTDFRMYFRVRPPANSDLILFLEEQKVSLLDISIGGAKFTYPKRYTFQPGENVKFKLIINEDFFSIDGVIRNVREPYLTATNKNVQYVSVEFRHDDKKMETALGKAILEIERSLLSKGQI
ncbi:MAG: PilZ domain-containing protein [Deltaproteobacteria bacterium]